MESSSKKIHILANSCCMKLVCFQDKKKRAQAGDFRHIPYCFAYFSQWNVKPAGNFSFAVFCTLKPFKGRYQNVRFVSASPPLIYFLCYIYRE